MIIVSDFAAFQPRPSDDAFAVTKFSVRQVRTVTGERDSLRRDVDRLSVQLSDMEVTAGV